MEDKRKTILIIEDNPGDQLLLQENLLNTDLSIRDIIMAETLTEGISYLHNREISLIFLDLFLPDSTGLDSFKELIKSAPRVPVIIYSGLSDSAVALNAISLGAQDFLIKGDYSTALLEKTVRYSIERKSNRDALEDSNIKFALISKATHDMIWDSDLITGKVHRNPEGWKKIFKSEGTEEPGVLRDFNSRVHPDDYEAAMKSFETVIESENQEVFDLEFRIIRDDGTIGWLEDRGYIIRNNKGKAVRLLGATHDITERKNAEQKTLLREQRFRSLVQNGSDLIGVFDKHGNYSHAGGSIKKVTGYDSASLIDKTPFSFIYNEDKYIVKEALINIETNSFLQIAPYRYKNAAGECRWMQTTLTNLLNDPAVDGIIANSRDITESKVAADEIEKLSLVAKNTLSGVFILDADRKIQWVNNAFTTITGFTIEDAIGKNPPDFLYGKDPDPRIFAELRSRMSLGLPFEGERLNYTKSGKPIWIWLQLQPLLDNSGEVKQYFAVQTDITAKKEADDELKKLSMVAKETINGVVISDKDQNVLWANQAFSRMCGYELEEVIGKNPMQLLQGPDTDIETINYVKKQINSREPFVFEILNYTKSNVTMLVRVQVQPIFDERGNVKQFFALQTDITKEKELERKVELEKESKLKEITEAVFTAQESERSEIGRELHDNVNQLLGATRLYIDMAKNEEVNRKSLLTSASQYTLEAIEEIRKLSKTLITPLIKEIGLADSIKDLADEIMLVYPIKISIIMNKFSEDGLDDKFKLNIFRIIQEQITNVIKHAKAQTLNINIADVSGNLVVSVTDNGIGFNTSVRKAGVGLTNIKSRSELHGGNVLLLSEPGKGTSLSITFNKQELFHNHACTV